MKVSTLMICNKCHLDKPLDDYPNNKKCIGGKEKICKKCKYERSAKWRESNPDYRHQYYLNNIDKHREQVKRYRIENLQRLSEKRRECYSKNNVRYRGYSRKHYWEKDKFLESRKARYTRYNKKVIAEIREPYVRKMLAERFRIPYKSVPKKLIELNIVTIQLSRTLKQRKPQWNQ